MSRHGFGLLFFILLGKTTFFAKLTNSYINGQITLLSRAKTRQKEQIINAAKYQKYAA